MRFKFIHAADLHLDSPFTGLSGVPEAIRAVLRESTFSALNRLVDLAIREKADFVLIAGDVYESADRSLRAQVRFQKAMRRLAERGISAFVIHGNHDPLDGRDARLDLPDCVHIFAAGQVERVPVVLPGRGHVADVLGISYPTAAVNDNYALLFRREGTAPYQIGLLHANVDGAADHADYAPCTLKELVGRGLDYWALGHVHGRRILNERPFIVYPGNLQGRSVRETGPKGCYVAEVDGSGDTNLAFHALHAVRWSRRTVSIAGLRSVQELKDRLEQVVEEERHSGEGTPVVLRIVLEDRGPLHRLMQGSAAQELLEELRNGEADRAEAVVSAGIHTALTNYGAGLTGTGAAGDFVWLESMKVRTGLDVDLDVLSSSSGFVGDVLRMSEEILKDREELLRFAVACMEPMSEHPRAGAMLRRSGLAGTGGPDAEASAEWLRMAAEWLVDRLTDGEEESG
jgi:DNA repair protein SbcD/Mre11